MRGWTVLGLGVFGAEKGKLVEAPADFNAITEVAIPLFRSSIAAVRGGGEGVGTSSLSVKCAASFGERSMARSIESGRRFFCELLTLLVGVTGDLLECSTGPSSRGLTASGGWTGD